jgi:hypothetical protein
MSAPAAAPATGFEIGGTSIFSDGCWRWRVCSFDSSGINTELLLFADDSSTHVSNNDAPAAVRCLNFAA